MLQRVSLVIAKAFTCLSAKCSRLTPPEALRGNGFVDNRGVIVRADTRGVVARPQGESGSLPAEGSKQREYLGY